MKPVNIVEGKGFKDWMHTLEPGYTVPKREAVMHAVDAKYMSIWAEIFRLKHCEAVSLTTDIWTPLQMEAYLTVTVHFITKGDWKMLC